MWLPTRKLVRAELPRDLVEHRKDVPGRVVVSEYVDVAHAFVDGDETGMVNAVLDQIARRFRGDEFSRG